MPPSECQRRQPHEDPRTGPRAALPATALAAAAVLFAAAILAPQPAPASGLAVQAVVAADPLAGSEWQPVEIGGETVTPPPEVFLQFRGEGRVAGLGGCNRFSGSYEIKGTAIAFGPLAATRMACAPPAMEREDLFLGALAASRRYARDGIRLVLRDNSGSVAMRLEQRDAD